MAKLIDGKKLAEQIRNEVKNEITQLGIEPQLAVVLVGEDPASKLYISLKEKACHEAGIASHKYYLAEDATTAQVLEVINFLNNDDEVTGILVQLPMPKQIDEHLIIAAIDQLKDVDGFGPKNLADFMSFKAKIIPGLPNSIYELIKSTGTDLAGKETLVISNSEVFAKPIINMMEYKKGRAHYASPDDPELKTKTQGADIIIIAVGRKWFLDKTMVKNDSIIIDVGINNDGGKIYGDVNPDVDEVAAFRSPVPGGVGPMTIAMLLKNTLELYKLQNKK